jgi:hypothetical protein
MRLRTIDWLSVATVVVLMSAPALRAQECDDSDPCTINDMCGADGMCHGTVQAGAACDDFNACTINDTCQAGGGCMGAPAPVGTACGGGCGTCQQPVPLQGVPTICSGSLADNGKTCDPGLGLGNCLVGQCSISAAFAFCNPKLKQCPTSNGCKGFCNFNTGECDSNLLFCAPNCERCNTATNTCEPANLGVACDDGNVCTGPGNSSCQILSGRGLCLAGTPSAASPTPTATPLGGATATATQPGGVPTATATHGPVGTATASPTPGPCVGDCNGNGVVAVNELIIGVNIALGSAPISLCPSFDLNNDDMIEVNELVAGVNAALNGCV